MFIPLWHLRKLPIRASFTQTDHLTGDSPDSDNKHLVTELITSPGSPYTFQTILTPIKSLVEYV